MARTVQNAGELLTERTGPRPVTASQPVTMIVTSGRRRPAAVNLSRYDPAYMTGQLTVPSGILGSAHRALASARTRVPLVTVVCSDGKVSAGSSWRTLAALAITT